MKLTNPRRVLRTISFFVVLLFMSCSTQAQYIKGKQLDVDSVKISGRWYKNLLAGSDTLRLRKDVDSATAIANRKLNPGDTLKLRKDVDSATAIANSKLKQSDTLFLRKDVNAKLDTGKQSVAGTIAYFRRRTVYDTSIQYTVIDYRKGGIFKYVATDSISNDNTGDTIRTGNNRRLYRIRNKETEVNIDWYIEDSERIVNDYSKAWVRAKAALPKGGTINFSTGTYNTKDVNGWLLEKDNLTMQGSGMDSTVITADSLVTVLMTNYIRGYSGYLLGANSKDTANVFTYYNTLKKGDGFIRLKNAAWASKIKVGMVVQLVAGSHYLDQEFGELNRVKAIGNDTIYLEKPLSRQYALDSSMYYGTVANNVVMPPVGSTVTITVAGGNVGNLGELYSFGDNIFYLVSTVNSTTGVYMNLGKGNVLNPGDTLKAGTVMMNGRRLMIDLHQQKLTINDLTITGKQGRIFRIDNTYEGRFNRIKIRKESNAGGFIYSADFTRGLQFEQCVIQSGTDQNAGSQISRSTGDLLFHKCTFNQVGFDISEMSFNTVVDDCDISVTNVFTAFRQGKSTTSSTIKNCRIAVKNVNEMINMDDVQNLTRVQREETEFINNTVTGVSGNGLIAHFFQGGLINISNNTFTGRFYTLTNSFANFQDTNFLYETVTQVNNNVFNNIFDSYVFINGAYNLVMKGNYFKYPTADTNNVIWTGFAAGIPNGVKIKRLEITDNIFDNYYYDDTYFDLGVKLSDNIIVKDNHFIHTRGTRLSEFWLSYGAKSSTHTLSDVYAPLIYSPSLDSAMYINRILNIGGDTTGAYKVGKVLKAIYANGLRSKIIAWYPLLGDSLAATVPAIGYNLAGFEEYKKTPRRIYMVGNGITYNPSLGFIGISSKGSGIMLARIGDVDYKNSGYFFQQTKIGTTTGNSTYMGGGNGGIGKTAFGQFAGMGGQALINSFTEDTAFVYSGQNQYSGMQVNFYDNGGTKQDLSNTTYTASVYQAAATMLFNRYPALDLPSDAGIGTAGITRGDLTLNEVKALKTIMRNFMKDIGRPYQTGSPDATINTDTSLNATAPNGDVLRISVNNLRDTTARTLIAQNALNIAVNAVAIQTKMDSVRRVGTNVQMLKNGVWTTVFTDSSNAPITNGYGLNLNGTAFDVDSTKFTINRGQQIYKGNSLYNLYVRPNTSISISKAYIQDTLLTWKLFMYNGLQGGNPNISNSRNNRAFDFDYAGGVFGLIGNGTFDYTLPGRNGTLATTSDIIPYQNGGTGLTMLGTSGQSIRVNTAGTGYEFYTPSTGGGTGTVQTVNGIAPDGTGNITIPICNGNAPDGTPTISATGTGVSSATLTGDNGKFELTITTTGAVAGTVCNITFSGPWFQTPVVVSSLGNLAAIDVVKIAARATSTTSITVSGSISSAGTYYVEFICR